MGVLENVNEPRDLRDLDVQQLVDLAAELRAFLIDRLATEFSTPRTSKTSGNIRGWTARISSSVSSGRSTPFSSARFTSAPET